jgi:hypothetical protein
MPKIKLRTINPTDKGAIVKTDKPGLIFNFAGGANEYACGSCGQTLAVCNPGQINGLIAVCGNCGTHNAVET